MTTEDRRTRFRELLEMLVIDLRIDAKDLLRDGLPNGQAGAFWKSQGLLEAASRLAAVLDTEGDRPTPCVPGSHHPDCLCYRRPDPPVQP
jgi:hypothetical protein